MLSILNKEKEVGDLAYLKDFTTEEVNKLIKKGDYTKVFLEKKEEKMENIKDEGGNLLTYWLLIKREDGKIEVEKEDNC